MNSFDFDQHCVFPWLYHLLLSLGALVVPHVSAALVVATSRRPPPVSLRAARERSAGRVRAASVYLTEGALSRLAYNYGITAGPSEPALITINLTDVHETRRVNP